MTNWNITISEEEKMRLQMILVDNDKEDALLFLKELNQKLLKDGPNRGIKKPNLYAWKKRLSYILPLMLSQ